MQKKHRYSSSVHAPADCRHWQADFFKRAGKTVRLLLDMFATTPNVALFAKDACGRIVYMNDYNLSVSGWQSMDDVLGYTSEELFEPDLAAVYSSRDREVLESGVPIVNRLYGSVANRSNALNCVSVYPVEDAHGCRIGTVTTYYLAEKKLGPATWYAPVRKAINYIDHHLDEPLTVEKLAETAHYSIAQFRHHFRTATHLSPSNYIQQTRINAAKTLLKTTDKRISDIANETGFYDQPHFIRVFAKFTNTTPAHFRRQFRE